MFNALKYIAYELENQQAATLRGQSPVLGTVPQWSCDNFANCGSFVKIAVLQDFPLRILKIVRAVIALRANAADFGMREIGAPALIIGTEKAVDLILRRVGQTPNRQKKPHSG